MTERSRQHVPIDLLPAARSLVSEVERLSGLPIVIEPHPGMGGRARAAYVASDPDRSRHLIVYDPAFSRFLDHMIPHECGHIVRYCSASPDEARLLVQHREGADFERLGDEVGLLLARGMPTRMLEELLPLWIHGSLAQLQNVPADIHIERWLHREFPALREAQMRSIRDQAQDYVEALSSDVREFTPPQVWLAGNAMNYAFLKSMGELLERPDLYEPYDEMPKVVLLGELLLDVLNSRDDTGLRGDRELTDLWAQRLGMDTWYRWRRLDQLPKNARSYWTSSGNNGRRRNE